MICTSPKRRLAGLAVTGLAALLVAAATDPAAAAPRSNRDREPKRDDSVLSRPAGVPLMAIVSVGEQRVTIYDAQGRILRAPVSTGQTGYETPAGIYSVIQKEAEHYSNLYDDASMPFMQRITWSGIALHAGRPARAPRLARLHPHAARVRRAPVRDDGDGHARDRGAHRRDARRHRASGPVQAAAARPGGVGCRPARLHAGAADAARRDRVQRSAAHHTAKAPRHAEVDRGRQGGGSRSRREGRGRGQIGRRQAGNGVGAPRQGAAAGGGRQEQSRGDAQERRGSSGVRQLRRQLPSRPQSSAPRKPRPRRRPS